MTKAKSAITLTLRDGPLAQVSSFVDSDDNTAKELWDQLDTIYRMSNNQMVININRDLEGLTFNKDDEWEAHVETFHGLMGKLAAYDKPVPLADQASKMIRTLPSRFDTIAMFAESNSSPVEKIVASVKAEIARRASQGRHIEKNLPIATAAFVEHGRNRAPFPSGVQKPRRDNNCFVCGKPGHYADKCWFRSDQGGSRGRGRGRGRGRARGRGRGFGFRQFGQHPSGYNNPHSQGWGVTQQHDSAPPQAPNRSFSTHNQPSANVQGLPPQPPLNGRNGSNFQGGFMARCKFRSTVATIDEFKSPNGLIDSGGTHHFFHSKDAFLTYAKMSAEAVQSASGVSVVVGQGTVHLPINGGIVVEAYHTPMFSTNIVSVGQLTSLYNVLFSCDPPARDGISSCIVSLRGTREIIMTTEIADGLYTIAIGQPHKMSSSHDLEMVSCAACYETGLGVTSLGSDQVSEWHKKLGHPSAERFLKLMNFIPDIPKFAPDTVRSIICPPCSISKSKKAPILPSNRMMTRPLELIHIDVAGPMTTESIGGRKYALGIVDDFTSKSDVYFLSERSQVYESVRHYMARAERTTGCRLQNIRLDGAGEHKGALKSVLGQIEGVHLEYSPPYASESNGLAERFVQELSLRSRVMIFGTDLGNEMWAEAMHHGNWLRNRLPSRRIGGQLPILAWKPNTVISFNALPVFGQPGYAFVYRPATDTNKKLSARSVHARFVGMESDERLCRAYDAIARRVFVVRLSDFKQCKSNQLPSISTLLDGLAQQSEIARTTESDDAGEHAEEGLLQAFHSQMVLTAFGSTKKRKDPHLPQSFNSALQHPAWCAAIDREYFALRKRGTWTFVQRSATMNVLPITWVFRIKPLNRDGSKVLHKARCCVRGDLQEAEVDYDPFRTYAPVASHETVRALLAYAASHRLIVEGGDVANAYLYGDIDCTVFIEQPTDSTGEEEVPGLVCKLEKSMYGIRQAGRIWGSVMIDALLEWSFKQSVADPRLLFLNVESEFVIITLVVDDMIFVSNSERLLSSFKSKLSNRFDVKFFVELTAFIGWEIKTGVDAITISQGRYVKEILRKHGLSTSNGTYTPMATSADVRERQNGETPLGRLAHALYRQQVGELLYLAVCTRPDIAFAVCALARSVHAPAQRHQELVRRVQRYLSTTPDVGIVYSSKSTTLGIHAYTDSDWAGCNQNRHSTTGMIVTVNGAPISWKSRRQSIVALSSAEAEYIALSTTGRELCWLRRLLWEIQYRRPFGEESVFPCIRLYTDNTAALTLAGQESVNSRTKHIDVKYHHIRSLRAQEIVELHYVPSAQNLADLLTKPVDRTCMMFLRELLLHDVGEFDDQA